jgi:hypothetical protein
MTTMSSSSMGFDVDTGQTREEENIRRPRPLRTCIIAVRIESFVGLLSNTSSQRIRDSSTFCDRTRANALRAYGRDVGWDLEMGMHMIRRTFSRSFFGCFLRSLLHATIADLLDPVSRASGTDVIRIARRVGDDDEMECNLTVDGTDLTVKGGGRHDEKWKGGIWCDWGREESGRCISQKFWDRPYVLWDLIEALLVAPTTLLSPDSAKASWLPGDSVPRPHNADPTHFQQ